MSQLTDLPLNLPPPEDDGQCDHLTGIELPAILLPSTTGALVNLAKIDGCVVVYCYPMTGRPDTPLPEGWDAIPGARGCTPQSCAFRDHYHELQALNVSVYGLSTQTTEYQQEAVARLHLPFPLLSDASLGFTRAVKLPTFHVAGMDLTKRITLIAISGVVRKVFYPVFPPDKNADDVLQWLRGNWHAPSLQLTR